MMPVGKVDSRNELDMDKNTAESSEDETADNCNNTTLD